MSLKKGNELRKKKKENKNYETPLEGAPEEEHDDNFNGEDFNEEDTEEDVMERIADTDTEQEAESGEDERDSQSPRFIAKDKTTRWKKHKPPLER